MSIITLTKQDAKPRSSDVPLGGAGAPGIDLVAQEIKEHFDNRWGQYPPVMEAEASLLAKAICSFLQTGASGKAR